jgi:hypothetical protein
MVGFNVKTTRITHIPIIVLFHQIGLERLLSFVSGRGDGTKAATVSTPLSGHMVSKWGAAMATPVVVAPIAATPGAMPSPPGLVGTPVGTLPDIRHTPGDQG